MDYYQLLGLVTAALIAILGFFIKLYFDMKKNTLENQKPLQELNGSIIQLTSEIKHMGKSDEIRDRRITKHGEEIEILQKDVTKIDKRLTLVEEKEYTK